MKKLHIFIFSFVFALAGIAFSISGFGEKTFSADLEPTSITSTSDFVNMIKQQPTGNFILDGDLDFQGMQIDTSSFTFSGTFDGNGYSLSNFTVSSETQNIGLFSTTQGATIKNLKIDGEITFLIPSNNDHQLYIGMLVGRASNKTYIQNCQIGGQQFVTIKGADQQPLQSTTKFTFGGVVGLAEWGCEIKNCVTYIQGDLTTSWSSTEDAKGPIMIGGIVGTLNSSQVYACVSFNNLTLASDSSNIIFYAGGIVGELRNDATEVVNTASQTLFTLGQTNHGALLQGGIFGDITAKPNNIGCNYYYARSNIGEIYGRKVDQVTFSDQEGRLARLTNTFLSTSSNWNFTKPYYDFLKDWNWDTGENLQLQVFMYFSYTFYNDVDENSNILQSATFNKTDGLYKYNQPVVITLSFMGDYKGYYTLKNVNLNREAISLDDGVEVEERIENNLIAGYNITLIASGATEGAYSFQFEEVQFSYEVSVAQVEGEDFYRGGVLLRNYGQGTAMPQLPPQNVVYKQEQTVEAVKSGIYSFERWELFVFNVEQGDYIKDTSFTSTNPILTFTFGKDHFNMKQSFKLVAHFNDKEAISVNFVGFDSSILTNIKFGPSDYMEEYDNKNAIRVAVDSITELSFVVKKGYVFNLQAFINYMSTLYRGKSTSLIESSARETLNEEDGSTTYNIKFINFDNIKDYLSGRTNLNFELRTQIKTEDDGYDYTWVWIVVGVSGGLILIGAVIAFFVIRRRKVLKRLNGGKTGGTASNSQKKVKKAKEKEVNYKDYYG